MKRMKKAFSRPDFMKTGAFVSASVAGAGLMVGANPEPLNLSMRYLYDAVH